MGFEVAIQDLAGDKLDVSTNIGDVYAENGGLATIGIERDDGPAVVALDRDGLVALRSAIDMILIANEAKTALRSDMSRIGRRLYRFSASFARMGTLSGIFVATDDEIRNAIGRRLSFGDALGKHSDVRLDLEAKHFTVLTDDQSFIDRFLALGCSSGKNPFEYLEEEEI